VYRNVVLIAKNILNFYETYGQKVKNEKLKMKSYSVLDKWILARLDETVVAMTKGMEKYDLTSGSRPLLGFVTDLSVWYVRRSRERIKSSQESAIVSEVLRRVLETLSRLMAPFTPFTAEMIYQKTKGAKGKESVHLEDWPSINSKFKIQNSKLLKEMEMARKIVELGHRIRKEQGIKVRQPLSQLHIQKKKIAKELLAVIADELNIKQVETIAELSKDAGWVVAEEGGLTIALDATLSQELREEGLVRDIIRSINALRKEWKMSPQDLIDASYWVADKNIQEVVDNWLPEIIKKCSLKSLTKKEMIGVSNEVKGELLGVLKIEGKQFYFLPKS
ncbi:MAG TPA: class I tRNA ligase family protein, partial [Patescibacteria group bacterium]|nr:class I tRNA ligase family protein [Patescibacteria group bacterium]